MGKKMMNLINNERGNIAGKIIAWLIVVIVICAAVYAGAINQKWVTAPPALASQPWMQGILPKEESTEAPPVLAMNVEATLRSQVIVLNSQVAAAEARAKSLEEELAAKERAIQERDDQIAQLQDTINLARNQNIANVALIYENMEPQDAATILTNLGADRASLILAEMRESKAADVLALMDDAIATQITQLMAGFEGGARPPQPQTTQPTQPPPGPVVPQPTGPPAGTDM